MNEGLHSNLGGHEPPASRLDVRQNSFELVFALVVGVVLVAEVFQPWLKNVDYPPLDETRDSIRLLTVYPGGSWNSISCGLASTTFSENPEYDALSYCWGDPKWTRAITVNGAKVRVQQNLYDVLCHLRHPTEKRYLWVDSLCINQVDTSEKNKQIPLMSFIYRRAQHVIIWLGKHTPSDHVKRGLEQGPGEWADESTRREKSAAWKQMEDFLWHLIHEDYWKRTWIIQEVGMASKIKVYYGKKYDSLSWGDFMKWVNRYRSLNPTDIALNPIFALEAMRQSKYSDPAVFSLRSLVDVFKDSFCSDPHDKIYAFLGLAHDTFDDHLPVDYRKSLFQLYQDITRFHGTGSSPEMEDKAVELLYHSALVRRLLTREAVQYSKAGRIVFSEDKTNAATQCTQQVVPLKREENVVEKKSHQHDSRENFTPAYTSYKYGFSATPITSTTQRASKRANWKTGEGEKNEEDADKESSEEDKKKEKKTPSYTYIALAGTVLLLSAGAIYYYMTRPDPPKEWHWVPSEPEEFEPWAEDVNPSNVPESINIRGMIIGQISQIGPETQTLASSHSETRHWTSGLSHYFNGSDDLKRARGLNEKLLALLNNPKDPVIRNVCSINPESSVLDQIIPIFPRLFIGSTTILNPPTPTSWRHHIHDRGGVFVGLIPPSALPGDIICQFWNSNACAVLRPRGCARGYELVGRAAIVRSGADEDWDTPTDKAYFEKGEDGTVDLSVSLNELTRLSLDTVNLPGTGEKRKG